jgi:hypothetical protein
MELFPLLESKNIYSLDLRDKFLIKRGLQHTLTREIIGQERWRHQKSGVQTASKRSFILLQQKFEKELLKIIKDVKNGFLLSIDAKRKSRKIFETYYRQAYFLGLKSAGIGISKAYSDLTFNFYGDINIYDAENKWSQIATASETKFWSNFIDKVADHSSIRHTLEQRVKFYVASLEGHYDVGRVTGSPNNSFVYWSLEPGRIHCKKCKYMGHNSPWPKELLVTTPKSGFCPCLMNCKCSLRIIPVEQSEYQQRKQELPTQNQIIRTLSQLF